MGSARLLRGAPAREAVSDLLARAGDAIATIAVDPEAARGGPLRVLALAAAGEALLVDMQAAAGELDACFASDRPFGAYDAKGVHAALLRWAAADDASRGGAPALPKRWACIRLSEQLLAGGDDSVGLHLKAIAGRYGEAALADPNGGLEAFAAHVATLERILARQVPRLRDAGLTRVSRIEAAAVAAVATMQHRGMPFAADRWQTLNHDARQEQEQLEACVCKHLEDLRQSGLFDFAYTRSPNLHDDAELRATLQRLGWRVDNLRRATLAALPEPLGPWLARWRELETLVTIYGDAFLAHTDLDGRIRPTFEQIGASTGRMACHSPNLQSVVKDGAHRACFRCADDRRLVVADYATCELRILAEMSGDPVFLDAFERGEDVHARVASRVFGRPVSKTENPELRHRAKAVNFGLVYGMGAAGLARAIGISMEQAQALLQSYFRTFPKIGTFLERSSHDALAAGQARTLTGRVLYLQADARDRTARARAARIAKNMPIQGTSADITKIALARVHQGLEAITDAWLVHCVHDEIVVEAPAAQAQAVAELVARAMQAAGEEVLKRVPVAVDVDIETHWQ